MLNMDFDALYRENRADVFHQIERMVNNQSVSEELTQDVFVKVLENLDSFENRSEVSTWLHNITKYHVLNYLRDTKQQRNHEVMSIDRLPDSLQAEEVEDKVELDYSILPPRHRQCIEKWIQGRSRKEIAIRMGISEFTVKSYVEESKKLLIRSYVDI